MNPFDEFLHDGPERREITYRGKEKVVYFRRITGEERIALLKGQKMQTGGDGKPSMMIDLADSAERTAKLVWFSCCDESGKGVFKNVGEVKALPDDLINLLNTHASEVNSEDAEEPGKD